MYCKQLLLLLIGACFCNANQEVSSKKFATSEHLAYQVFLSYNNEYECGGVIVSNCWVLVAAHCVQPNANPSKYQVIPLLAFRNGKNIREDVTHIYRHSEYKGGFENDLALLKLKSCLKFDEFVSNVPLISSIAEDPKVDSPVLMFTYSQIKENERLRTILMAQSNIHNAAACGHYHVEKVAEKIMCGGLVDAWPTERFLEKHNGGPVIYNGKLVGILLSERGEGVATNEKEPSLYLKLSAYLDWINGTFNGTNTDVIIEKPSFFSKIFNKN